MTSSIWRTPGIKPLLAMTFLGFSGYVMLLPVAPLWAVHGGAGTAGAGLVNAVMLGFTVLSQLQVPAALRRWGWARVLVVGLSLLGLPGLLHVLSDGFGVVLGLSAVRGVGFGVLTVVGSSAVAALVEPRRRGAAIGAYGLAVALPSVLLLPAGPWLAEQVGFWLPFVISASPLLGIPASIQVASTLRIQVPDLLHPGDAEAGAARAGAGAAYRALLRPVLLLLSVTLAGGALITFAPQMVSGGLIAGAGLLLMGVLAAVSRWRAGHLADRYGAERFLAPLIATTAAGVALVAWSVRTDDTRVVAFLVASVLVGLGYGALQNLTLGLAFDAVQRHHHNLASSIWNIGFDAGMALGSVAVGVLAAGASFDAAFWVVAVLVALVLPLAVRAPARG